MTLDTAELCGQRTDRGLNMATSSGRPFWPADPRPEDISIVDIAAHLSRICRFNGGLKSSVAIYSVAQHSVLVSRNVPKQFRLEALLHDAPEYVFGDRIKPIKLMMTGAEIKAAEERLDRMVRAKFGLPPTLSQPVKDADYRAVLTERRDILHPDTPIHVDWGDPSVDPWPQIIKPWGVFKARREFLKRFVQLTGGVEP